MALSERSRSQIYQGLEPLVGEEALGEMLSFFPARDVEEPVTKEFLRAEMAVLRGEMSELRGEMKGIKHLMAVNVGLLVSFAAFVVAAVRL